MQEQADIVATNEFCKHCAVKRGSCCADNHKIPLMMKDVKRISSLGHDPEEFLTVRRYDLNPEDQEDWWASGFLKANGGYFRASMRCVDGACVFLKDGCVLGNDRPFVCRIYPFWIDQDLNLVYDGDAHDCTITKQIADLASGLSIIGETRDEIENLWREIKTDLALNRDEHDEFVRCHLQRENAHLR